jgi:hypothetical protein
VSAALAEGLLRHSLVSLRLRLGIGLGLLSSREACGRLGSPGLDRLPCEVLGSSKRHPELQHRLRHHQVREFGDLITQVAGRLDLEAGQQAELSTAIDDPAADKGSAAHATCAHRRSESAGSLRPGSSLRSLGVHSGVRVICGFRRQAAAARVRR